MKQLTERSGTGIERSGTGIEKSGTGIEKSGTGIEKSGTGIARLGMMLVVFTAMTLSGVALASDARLALSTNNGHAIISVHGDDGVMVGVSTAPLDGSSYVRVPLYSVLQAADNGFSMGLMVQGSGSGKSGASVEPGGQLLVQGSGSGDAGESCNGGPTLLVQGSGSGSSGDSAGCGHVTNAWGIAEVVVDESGAHVVIHQIKGSHAEEYLVAFLPGSESEVAHSLYRGSSKHAFVAMP